MNSDASPTGGPVLIHPYLVAAGVKLGCPSDGGPLQQHVHQGLAVRVCHRCRGLWLPGDSWRTLCRVTGRIVVPAALATTAGGRHCPDCPGQALVPRHIRETEIDTCPRCEGVWLDFGEIKTLLAQRRTRSPGGQTSKGVQWVDVAGEAAQTGLELAADAGSFGDVIGDVVGGLFDVFSAW